MHSRKTLLLLGALVAAPAVWAGGHSQPAASGHQRVEQPGYNGPLPTTYVKTPEDLAKPWGRQIPPGYQAAIPVPKPGNAVSKNALAGTRPEEVYLDQPGDGNIWARGWSYKARFGSDAAEYIPFLGVQAPHNFPLGFTFQSATIGSTAIGSSGAVTPSIKGTTVTFDRGGIQEVYQLRPREFEQLFNISNGGTGQLIVRLNVSSELSFAGLASEGLLFQAPDNLGGVLYGKATMIDANGKKTLLPTVYADGSILITASAEAVAGAVFPVTIDPVVTTFGVDLTTPFDDFNPDVAFDVTNGKWCVAYEEVFSVADHDVIARTATDATPPAMGGFLYIDFTGAFWGRPRIANNNIGDGFLVGAQRKAVGGADFDIWGRIRNAVADTFFTVQFAIAATAGVDEINPDVGGDAFGFAPVYYHVVWESATTAADHDIKYCRVTHAAVPVIGVLQTVSAVVGFNEHNPAVSKSNGPPGTSGIVWVTDFALPDRDIFFRTVSYLGTLGAPAIDLDASLANDENPDIGTNAAVDFLVVFQRDFITDHDIMGIRLNGTVNVSGTVDLTFLEPGGAGFMDQINPSVDGNGAGYAYAYSEQFGGADYDIYESAAYGGAVITVPAAEGHVNLDFSSDHDDHPQTSSRWSSSYSAADGGRFMSAWDSLLLPAGTERDVRGGFHAPGSVGISLTACGAPGPSIGFVQAPSLGGPFGLTGAAGQGGVLVLLIGTPLVTDLFCGGPPTCKVGVDITTAIFIPGFVSPTIFAVPNNTALIGGVLGAQLAEIAGGGVGGCFFGVTVTASDTLIVTLD